MTDSRMRASNELVRLFLKSPNTIVTGRALRSRLSGIVGTLDEQRQLAASLAPELADHNASGTGDDWFRPTLHGMLLGYPPTADIVALTLRFFRQKARHDPEFNSFTWPELRSSFESNLAEPGDADDNSELIVRHVLDVAGLASGWNGYRWRVPGDIESLSEVQDAEELILKRAMASSPVPAAPGPVRQQKTITTTRIFIGHSRSAAWRDLKDFIKDRLGLSPEEFNSQSVAGRTTQARLQELLDTCKFAFLVLTGDDEGPNGAKSPRPNVVHELGLFQGRLGFERAIVLLEEGCTEFSNIVGLTQIRFPETGVSAVFEEIRKVLEREQILR